MGFAAGAITNPVNRIIGLSAWSIAFALILGAVNGWYMQAVDAGVVGAERFDRVVAAGSNNSEDAWKGVTAVVEHGGTAAAAVASSAYKLGGVSGACTITAIVTTAEAGKYYTPAGSSVTVGVHATAAPISGCKYASGTSIFNTGGLGGLASLILQACGLAAPVVLMFELGKLGQNFATNFTDNAILGAVITVIMFLVVATLLNVFVPFLTGAFSAVDSNRFAMFDSGLGTIAVVIRNFWGIVLIGSLLGVAWSGLGNIRGGGGPNEMGSARTM